MNKYTNNFTIDCRTLLNTDLNPEVCEATGDDSKISAGNKILHTYSNEFCFQKNYF